MSSADEKVHRLLLNHAREAYLLPIGPSSTVPIDLRCPACGIDRPVCASRTCIRREP